MTPAGSWARASIPSSWADAWDRMSSRERRLAIAAAGVVVLAAAWVWIWQPMQDDTVRLRRELPRDRAVLATAHAQVNEMSGLQRSAQTRIGGSPGGDARMAVERVLSERGLTAGLTALDAKDGRIHLAFATIAFDALVGALDALAKTDGLRAVEATLTARIDPGTVRAEITLAR